MVALAPLINTLVESTRDLAQTIQSGDAPARLGLRRAARLTVAVSLQVALQRPVLLITDRADHALTLTEELELWIPGAGCLLFPEPTPLFYENAAWGENTRRERLLALTTLASYHIPGAPKPASPPLVIAPARALMTRTMPRRDFLSATRALKRGQMILLDELVRNWVLLGYEPVHTVIMPGQFARRGGILDLWPPAEAYPFRLEFFGDEIETMRRFNPTTQRTLSAQNTPKGGFAPEKVLVTPAREYLLPSNLAPATGDPDAQRAFMDMARGISEFDIPMLHNQPASLLDYLPQKTLVLIDEAQALEDIVAEVEEQAVKMRQEAIAAGTLPDHFPLPYLTWPDLQDSLDRHKPIELGPSTGSTDVDLIGGDIEVGSNLSVSHQTLAEHFSPGPRFGGRLKPAMEYIAERCLAGDQVLVVSRQSARLQELWKEYALPSGNLLASAPIFLEGSLGEGWVLQTTDGRLADLLTDGEIFGWRRPKPRYRRNENYAPAGEEPESGYSDLHPGDYVVHVDHGIGRFIGLVNRVVDNIEREYLCVGYADDTELFVPIHQVDRLTRYVGADNRTPMLSRLGSAEWKTVKSHVKEAVQEVAEELLELYAKRSIIQGYTFGSDTPWQQELEASFPYIETEDQVRVIDEVKQDMESPHPMDRLICGDVGYGKTEVALRAAFKALNDSRQVAVLVPTTVLAQQHYHTFRERLAAFPVEVEMLSRFRTPQQQREIIERLGNGRVDIVIGTHRLLSSDVIFKDLGLLIIDEEQRFGVTHKETLKKMRTEVDVLTLTATPIPRTLYMALTGVRDISIINTPPEERLPIVTHVGPYSQALVRQAVLRELERGGQVFFVHNRVQTIGAMRNHLEKLVPEARITIAHGQMAENELSQRMEAFTNGDIDILLSTSIIESGLDIPNANTLIVDRADTFGLAQLYQLRGRVGRGAQRAYAYFFRHKRKQPTEEGRMRLDTIAENTQLGAGFSIAMRDLEIRGTGDILGTRQHGHIAAVGFYLYTRLLAEAVRRLRGRHDLSDLTARVPIDESERLAIANVELPLPASIPTDYVADKIIRLSLYRRIASLRALTEIEPLQEEFTDRFGPPPETVHNLLFQTRLKLLAEKAGLASITSEGHQIVLRFPEQAVPDDLPDLGPYVRVGKIALWMLYSNIPDWTEKLVELLEKLSKYRIQALYPQQANNLRLGAGNHALEHSQ